jgi:hypothetical protein
VRARGIKPGLLKNEVLGVADALYTILFEGLWMLADRSGRLEDRPLRIKAEVFPYRDGLDPNAMLGWLQSNGFIQRYTVSGVAYIQILSFDKHQNPHVKEPASVIPAPDEHGASTVQAPDKHQTSTSVARLTPDSGLLTPDSGEKKEPSALVASADAERAARGYTVPPCPTQDIVTAYAEVLPMLPQVAVLNDSRRRAIAARWREVTGTDRMTAEQGREWFRWFFDRVRGSPFLTGNGAPDRNGRVWRADLDWLMAPTHFARVIEGRYHGGKQA